MHGAGELAIWLYLHKPQATLPFGAASAEDTLFYQHPPPTPGQPPTPTPRPEHFCRDMLPAPPHKRYFLGQWPRTFAGTRASFLLKQNEEGGVYWTESCVTEQITVCESSLGQGRVLEEWVVLTGRKGQGRLEDWRVPHTGVKPIKQGGHSAEVALLAWWPMSGNQDLSL